MAIKHTLYDTVFLVKINVTNRDYTVLTKGRTGSCSGIVNGGLYTDGILRQLHKGLLASPQRRLSYY